MPCSRRAARYPVSQDRSWDAFINKPCPKALEHFGAYEGLVMRRVEEKKRYPSFIEFANAITTNFEAMYPGKVARLVRFQSYPDTCVTGAPSYHVGKPQDGTESSRQPDGAAMFSDINLNEHALDSDATTTEA
jgi:hypothetical protein